LGGSLAAAHQGGGQQTESKLSRAKRNGEFRNVSRANKHLEIVPDAMSAIMQRPRTPGDLLP